MLCCHAFKCCAKRMSLVMVVMVSISIEKFLDGISMRLWNRKSCFGHDTPSWKRIEIERNFTGARYLKVWSFKMFKDSANCIEHIKKSFRKFGKIVRPTNQLFSVNYFSNPLPKPNANIPGMSLVVPVPGRSITIDFINEPTTIHF